MANGEITSEEYMQKLEQFIAGRTNGVIGLNNQYQLKACYDKVSPIIKQHIKHLKSHKEKEEQYERTDSNGAF